MTRRLVSLPIIAAGLLLSLPTAGRPEIADRGQEVRELTRRIESLADKEPTLNSIETKLRLSELLQQTRPALANRLLVESLEQLRSHKDLRPEDDLARSLLSLAPVEGERVLLSLDNKSAAYGAVIRYWLMRNELDRSVALYRETQNAGIRGLRIETDLLEAVVSRHPEASAGLFRDIVEAFPPEKPTSMDVWQMLICVSIMIVSDPNDADAAIEKILPLLDPSALAPGSSEIKAKYRVGNEEFRTASTQETLLFRVAVYLHALDPAAYARLRPRLESWEKLVAGITDVQAAKATAEPSSYTYWKPHAPPPSKAEPPSDFEKWAIPDSLAWIREKADPDSRLMLLQYLLSRGGLSSAQQHQIAQEALAAVNDSPPGPGRYYSAKTLFGNMRDLRMDDAILKQGAQEFAVALSGSEASMEEYSSTALVLRHVNTTIPSPDASLEACLLLLDLQELLSPQYDFTLPGLDGRTYRLTEQHGKVVVLNFWATWCTPCRHEMPDLEKAYKEWKDKGLVVFALTDEPAEKVRKFFAQNAYTFLPLLDSRRAVFDQFQVQGIPQSVIFDRDGKMVEQINDATTEVELLKALHKAGLF